MSSVCASEFTRKANDEKAHVVWDIETTPYLIRAEVLMRSDNLSIEWGNLQRCAARFVAIVLNRLRTVVSNTWNVFSFVCSADLACLLDLAPLPSHHLEHISIRQ